MTSTTTSTTLTFQCDSSDSDQDGYPDCADLCPQEPTLTAPSSCDCYPVEDCQDCLLAHNQSTCPLLIFGDNSNSSFPTQVIFGEEDTNITVSVQGPDNATVSLNFSWGSIREVDPKTQQIIKGISVTDRGWIRNIHVTPALLRATFFTTILPDDNFPFPLNITLTTEFIRNPAALNASAFDIPSLKLSLEIIGNWAFASPHHQLHVDSTFVGPFAENECGDSYDKQEIANDQLQFDLYGNGSTTLRIAFLQYCLRDTVRSDVTIRDPSVVDQVATFLMIFPSFNSTLFYDPSFALLLGRVDGSCANSLFTWILPGSFLLGALIISILICFIGSWPFALSFVKGAEGYRIHKLRQTKIRDLLSDSTPAGEIASPGSQGEDW